MPLIYLRAAPPYSLKPASDHPPSLRVVKQDEDGGEDLEGESEENPSESGPELGCDLNLDLDSVPYSSFS